MCASGTADPGLLVRMATLRRAANGDAHLPELGGLGEEDGCLVRKATYTRPYTSRMKLLHTTTVLSLSRALSSLSNPLSPLLYVCTCAHTRTIKMWRTRRCSGTHAHPVIHEEGQRFEQAPHVTSVHGVSAMPALTPRQGRSGTNLFRKLWVLDV